MTAGYNPIVRSYNRYRAALGDILGVSRCDLRPGERLEDLIPAERRQEVWKELGDRGLIAPDLYRIPVRLPLSMQATLVLAAMRAIWNLTGSPWLTVIVAPVVWPFCLTVDLPWASRPDEIPPFCRTVGELAVYGVHFKDHPDARWSRADISLKVRMQVAETCWLTLDDVRPETRLVDLVG
ncbi:MAG: hypothetical protein ACRDD1_15570 [Planctomycetia bacterium]